MPKSLTFADHYGFELLDEADNIDDDHDSDFNPADDDVSYSSYSSSSHSSDDDSAPGDDFAQPLLGLPTAVDNYDHNHDDQDSGDSQHRNDESNHSDDVSNN